jgi:transposase InsO family protein
MLRHRLLEHPERTLPELRRKLTGHNSILLKEAELNPGRIITAVVLEGRTQADVARSYGVSKGWVSKLVHRYRLEGDAAFEPHSRRPHTSPGRIGDTTIELIVRLRHELTEMGADAGAEIIAWHLTEHHRLVVSTATIWRTLKREGLITPEPKKRPKSTYLRFEADLPNETWQSDFTHWALADGTDIEILSWLDDYSRYALSCTAHHPVTVTAVLTTFRANTAIYGPPASTLTDNGLVFTARFRKGRNAFETELRTLNIEQKNGHPNHPQTQGKVERFQQTMKKALARRPAPETIDELQQQLENFRSYYNTRRPHRSLKGTTPAAAYAARPKATPAGSSTRQHNRIRRDQIDSNGKLTLRHNGKLHHIGIGRTHARTPILMLIQDLDIHIINARTGELIRELTLDPTKDYQP